MLFFYHSSILYLEGSLETKIFTDPATGLVRRVREVAIRRNGTFMNFFFPYFIVEISQELRVDYLAWYYVLFSLCV